MRFKKVITYFFFLFLLNNCSEFQPIYKNNIEQIYALQNFIIVTDGASVSKKIKKELITLFPVQKKSLYILKIEATIESLGIVRDDNRRIYRYKMATKANIKVYKRKKNIDELIYEFDERKIAPYNLISNNVRSSMASRKEAENISIQLIANRIYKRILIIMNKSQ